jgi:hypothetical protein
MSSRVARVRDRTSAITETKIRLGVPGSLRMMVDGPSLPLETPSSAMLVMNRNLPGDSFPDHRGLGTMAVGRGADQPLQSYISNPRRRLQGPANRPRLGASDVIGANLVTTLSQLGPNTRS